MAVLPGVKQVAVFDTAFHQTMPPAAYLYGLPYELYEKYRIRRYGFHGTSHRYVASRAMELLKRFPENTNVITCHLGNGASVTAIEHGQVHRHLHGLHAPGGADDGHAQRRHRSRHHRFPGAGAGTPPRR